MWREREEIYYKMRKRNKKCENARITKTVGKTNKEANKAY